MNEETDKFPLHTAAREGNVLKAEGLLKTDPRLLKKKDDDGRYPIHWAASSNNLEILTLLANQASFDPDVQDDSGWTPLMISASVADSEAVLRVLIQKGAEVNEKNSNGQTALHFVASKKNMDVARLLLGSNPPASTCFRDRRGQYPIHRAAAVGSVPMVLLLLKNKSPLNPADSEGYTPLHHAIAEGHGDVAIALLKEGADFTLKNSDDVLALDLAPDKEACIYIH
ncbi:Ankyrin repeat-containing domain protein [Metarhizium album ARSEF 1941]|uniref:Ankyrin repeat-containing domain protein n=1 Tax=Metarhizium album (strain ARSEF 1941) TaxID=1081103 RepID=A0A0B2WYQ8_METAS|nr:Ankyrin repeat-containing domain protein [Metarhizium album ARSEF 1941]KHN98562.1 Ankyrin repeat-containing domain protein [Metarhizium album ARSEF 1941]